ncbi:hypothetical protein ACW185_09575 [Limosilactobacillus fermentum]
MTNPVNWRTFHVQLALKNQLFIPARQFISLATHLTDAEGRLVKRAEVTDMTGWGRRP